MKSRNHISQLVMLLSVVMILCIPMCQQFFFKWKERALSGDISLAPDIDLGKNTWFNGKYATEKEKYLNDHFGFRNTFLRLSAQINYSFFKLVSAREVVPGKEGFLYELKYLQTYAGMDYVGDEKIKERFLKLKFIQDTLEKKGIHFAILFAPGKASFYPEFIPPPYDKKAQKTNYESFLVEAKRTGINQLDFNAYFKSRKSISKYPLYPKTGTHWSVYGMHLAFDTLTKYMEHLSGKKLRHFDYSKVNLSDDLQAPDGDIADGLNVLFEPPHFTMAYPIVKWMDSTKVSMPEVLTISDSYWMGIYFQGLPMRAFKNHNFWYYNKIVYNYDPKGKTFDPIDYDLKSSIEKNEYIFIMATEASLKQIGWGFIDEVYILYKSSPEAYVNFKKQRKYLSEMMQIKVNIQTDLNWFDKVKKQAAELKISLDSCIQINADYMYNETHKKEKPEINNIQLRLSRRKDFYKAMIKNNKNWLNLSTIKSHNWRIPFDSVIEIDAAWMAKKELKEQK